MHLTGDSVASPAILFSTMSFPRKREPLFLSTPQTELPAFAGMTRGRKRSIAQSSDPVTQEGSALPHHTWFRQLCCGL